AHARTSLQQRLSQPLVIALRRGQAIKILQASRGERETLNDQERTENPLLEENIVEEKTEGASAVPTVDGPNGAEEYTADEAPKAETEVSDVGEIDWKDYAENYSNDIHGSTGPGASSDDEDPRAALEDVLVKQTNLPDPPQW